MTSRSWQKILIPVISLGIAAGPLALPVAAGPVAGPTTAHLTYVPTGFSSGYLSATKFTWSAVANATSYNLITDNFAGAIHQQSGFTLFQTLGPDTGVGVAANLSGGGTSGETSFTLPISNSWVPMARFMFTNHTASLTSASSTFESLFSAMLVTFHQTGCGPIGARVAFKIVGATNATGKPDDLTTLATARAAVISSLITTVIPDAQITTSTTTNLYPITAQNRNATVSFKLLAPPNQTPSSIRPRCA
jgi:hypothetical protein